MRLNPEYEMHCPMVVFISFRQSTLGVDVKLLRHAYVHTDIMFCQKWDAHMRMSHDNEKALYYDVQCRIALM